MQKVNISLLLKVNHYCENLKMNEELFNVNMAKMLLSPEQWKFIAGFLPEEVSPVTKINMPEVKEKKLDRHCAREILVPLSGNYAYSFNGKCYNCAQGAMFLIDANIEHETGYTRYSDNLIHLWLFVGRKQILAQYLKIHHGRMESKRKIAINDFASDMNLYDLWEALRHETGEFQTFIARRKFMLALSLIFIKILEIDKTGADPGIYQKMMVEMVKDRIQKSFRQGIDLTQLAKVGGYSKFYFLRLFKQYSGYTVYEYFNQCRINEMKYLLQKKLSQKEIAIELGFSCAAAFSNWRKKMNGNT